MKKILIFCFILVLVVMGCKKSTNMVNEQSIPLVNTYWHLVSIQDTKTNAIRNYPAEVKQTWGFEQINFSEDTISIKGLCNGGRGTYSISSVNSSIKFDEIGMTLAFCKYEEWENYLWHNLDSAYSYRITGNQLTIYSSGTYNLNFIQQ
jgi:heat shock protein HslJ